MSAEASTTGRRTPSAPRRGRSVALQALLIGALLAGVAVALADLVPGTGRRLEHAAPGWIAAAVACELIALIAYAVLFHSVFSYGPYRLGHVRAAQIGIGELGAFVVVPAGIGGPAVRIWGLMRSGMPFGVVMARGVIHAVIFNVPYIGAALMLGIAVVLGIGPGHAPLAVALAPLGVILVTLAFALGLARLARARPDPPRPRWQRIGWEMVQAVPIGVRELPGRLRRPVPNLGAIGYWVGDCGVLIMAFGAVHGSPSLGVIVLAYMLGQLGNLLPLPGGVGGTEPIMLGVLTASGVGLGLGAAAVIIYRFISLGLQGVAGTIAVASLVRSLRLGAGLDRGPDGAEL